MEFFAEVDGFEWNRGNHSKNLIKHKISNNEAEQVFLDEEAVIRRDEIHSTHEERYIIIGKTEENKLLFVVFTLRKKLIRIISARVINKKEKKLYE